MAEKRPLRLVESLCPAAVICAVVVCAVPIWGCGSTKEKPLEQVTGSASQCSEEHFSWHYCKRCGPCEVGTGDCDRDSECKSGLVCKRDVGESLGRPFELDVCDTATPAPEDQRTPAPEGQMPPAPEGQMPPEAEPSQQAPGSCTISSRIVDAAALLRDGAGTISFQANDGNVLTAYTHRDSGFDPRAGRILFVMHGSSRTAEGYAKSAVKYLASAYQTLVVAPLFPKSLYPSSGDYNESTVNFETLESLFDSIVIEIGGAQNGYYIYGNSAGSQFVRRLMTFLPKNRVVAAVSAGGGATPVPRRDISEPSGLKGTPVEKADLTYLLSAKLTVMIGEEDNLTCHQDPSLPCSSFGGDTRLEKSKFLFNTAKQVAAAEGLPFGWTLAIIPGTGHGASGTIKESGRYLFSGVTTPTLASSTQRRVCR